MPDPLDTLRSAFSLAIWNHDYSPPVPSGRLRDERAIQLDAVMEVLVGADPDHHKAIFAALGYNAREGFVMPTQLRYENSTLSVWPAGAESPGDVPVVVLRVREEPANAE